MIQAETTTDLDLGRQAADTSVGTRIAVYGHGALVDALLSASRFGRIGPPLLFAGPPGAGKTTLARLTAQSLVCQSDEQDRPCGACRACRLVATDSHADVSILDSPLRIEAARTLIASLALAPVEGRVRVAIIPRIEAATPGAANSLLKTLEEPPKHAVILLTTASESDVLPTIRSRCRRIAVRPLTVSDAAAALVACHGIDRASAERAARLGGGCIGQGLRWIGDEALRDRAMWLDAAAGAVESDRVARIALADRLAKMGQELEHGLRLWLGWWRDVLLIRLGAAESVLNVDRLDDLQRLAWRIEPAAISAAAGAVDKSLFQLGAHATPASVLEVLVLGLPILSAPAHSTHLET